MEKLLLQWSTAITACLLTVSGAISIAHAEPVLNFSAVNPSTKGLEISCMPGVAVSADSCIRGGPGNLRQDPDTTPFLLETFIEPSTGLGYYHVMIGDPNSNFSQEYFIQYSGSALWFDGFRRTASAGTFNGGTDAQPPTNFSGIFEAPLSSNATISGNATGRPDRVIFKQSIKGTGFNQDVLKANLSKKPIITQAVNDGGIDSNFVIDMSGSEYFNAAALTTGGVITNTLKITDLQSGAILTDFDINTSSQNSFVTGGKYIYDITWGPWGEFGNYQYATGSFDIYAVDWKAYLDKNDPTNFDYINTIPNF